MNRLALLPLLAGCYDPPDFPPIEDLPIEPTNRCAPAREDELVACVLDGDTLDIGACGEELGERVRLLGINAPEIAHDPDPAECFGPEAEVALRAELAGERVRLTFDVDACEDTYGRALAWVWLEDPTQPDAEPVLINEWLVREGYARVYEDFIDGILYEQDLRDAEARAIAEGRGLWGACAN
ncbi:MAG: nuclease [Deltaproteobacteria bacterium]|nr:MAG: nuclease [Deltaproteobacteria bacterium]